MKTPSDKFFQRLAKDESRQIASITRSDLELANEAASNALELMQLHHATFCTQRSIIKVDDPAEQNTKRQRQIIDLALIALGTGDSAKVRRLLGEL